MRDWFHKLWNGVTGLAKDVKDAIFKAFDTAISWATDLFEKTTGIINYLGRLIGENWKHVENFAKATASALIALEARVVKTVMGWVNRVAHDIWGGIQAAKSAVVAFAREAIGEVRSWADGAFHWLKDNVWDPLWTSVKAAWHWLQHEIPQLIHDAIHAADVALHAAVSFLETLVHDLVGPFVHWAKTWLPIFERYGAELLHLLVHPIEWLLAKLDFVTRNGASWWVRFVVHAFTSEQDQVEEIFSRWLQS